MIKYAISSLFVFVTLFGTGCSGDDEPKTNERDFLLKTWHLATDGYVKHDDTDVTADYPGLSIAFATNGTYTTTAGKKLFYPSGTWDWASSSGTENILLDGDFSVTVMEISPTVLHISFVMDSDHVNPNGRVHGVLGNYEIMLNKN